MTSRPVRRLDTVVLCGLAVYFFLEPNKAIAHKGAQTPLYTLGVTPQNAQQSVGPTWLPAAPMMQESQPLFPEPVALMRAIDFWTELFLHLDSHHAILHDRDNLHIIWQTVTLQANPDGALTEEDASQQIRHAMDALRLRLQRLEITATSIDPQDSALLDVWRASGQQNLLQGSALRLRGQRGVSEQFSTGLLRAKLLLPGIRKVLREEGVPEQIAVLPFVETMYNPKARSTSGAVGLWQLMPQTARDFGLQVNRRRDERTDVSRATRVAARILKANYHVLGSWPLAITAYNHGCNGLRRAVALIGSSDLAYLIQNYQRSTWGFASKNFYAEFLAALHIISDVHPEPIAKTHRKTSECASDRAD